MTKTSFAQGQLRSLVERIERLEAEKAEIAADIKEIYAEAKANGYDTKILRKVISIRKQDAAERQEQEAMIDVYQAALGMAPAREEEHTETASEAVPQSMGAAAPGARSPSQPLASASGATSIEPGAPPSDSGVTAGNGQGGFHQPPETSAQPVAVKSPEPVPDGEGNGGVDDVPDIPPFMDRRKPSAADYLAAG